MIVTLQTERIRTLDQMRAFVEGSEAVDFTGTDRESVYEFVRQALVRMDYAGLGKSDKRLVRRYLAKVTGLLRAPPVGSASIARPSVSRTGAVALACPFEQRYTRADVRQLAAVDAAMGQMSGPATPSGSCVPRPVGRKEPDAKVPEKLSACCLGAEFRAPVG